MRLRNFEPLRLDLFEHRLLGIAVAILAFVCIVLFAAGPTVAGAAFGAAVAAYLVGWGIEVYQAAFTKDRTPDPADALVTAAGGIEGAVLAATVALVFTPNLMPFI